MKWLPLELRTIARSLHLLLLAACSCMGGAKQEGPTLNPNLTPELTADSLSQFPLDERRKLQAAVLDPSFDGVFSADVVQDLLLSEGGPRNIQS